MGFLRKAPQSCKSSLLKSAEGEEFLVVLSCYLGVVVMGSLGGATRAGANGGGVVVL